MWPWGLLWAWLTCSLSRILGAVVTFNLLSTLGIWMGHGGEPSRTFERAFWAGFEIFVDWFWCLSWIEKDVTEGGKENFLRLRPIRAGLWTYGLMALNSWILKSINKWTIIEIAVNNAEIGVVSAFFGRRLVQATQLMQFSCWSKAVSISMPLDWLLKSSS